MKLRSFVVAGTVAFSAAVAGLSAQSAPTVDGLVSQAKQAAGTEWTGTFARLCIPPPPAQGRGAAAGRGDAGGRGAAPAAARGAAAPAARGAAPAQPAAARGAGPARETWYAEPAKVGDNFYFLGTKVHHSWALAGRDGIIVIEALFDYAVADEVAGGLKQMGLDVRNVKFAVMSHAHGDHDGGAAYLQDVAQGGRLVYGAEDWKSVEARTGPKPKTDMIGTDGQTLSVGDASIRIITTPGHTPGTLSYLFEFRDRGRPIRVAYVGGTAIPFNESAAWYDQYIASSRKLAQAAAEYGATAIMSNHTEFDNGYFKAHTAANRKSPDVPNPFDVGRESVARYFNVVQLCTEAAKLRASQTPRP